MSQFQTSLLSSSVVIVSAARTPVGSFNGALSSLPAHELGKVVIEAVLEGANIAAESVDEVILGQVLTTLGGKIPHVKRRFWQGFAKKVRLLALISFVARGCAPLFLACSKL